MNLADMKGDGVLVWRTCQALWDSRMGHLFDWPLLLGTLIGLLRLLLVWCCLWTVSSILPKGSVTSAQVAGCRLRLQLCPRGSPQALSVPLQLNSLVCTVGPPWVPVFMI